MTFPQVDHFMTVTLTSGHKIKVRKSRWDAFVAAVTPTFKALLTGNEKTECEASAIWVDAAKRHEHILKRNSK